MSRSARLLVALLALLAVGVLVGCGSGIAERDAAQGSTVATTATSTVTTRPDRTTTTEAPEPAPSATTATTAPDRGDVPAADPPVDLGDDPALDALADDCFGGDFAACDQLFFDSEANSAYEAYGDSCGGRNEPAGLCTDIYGQP